MSPGPMTASEPRITQLLRAWGGGNRQALDDLLPLVHDELRQIARCHMRGERERHTLQPTALVSEAYLRLLEIKEIRWEDREHFFAVAARLMRRILIDSARARKAAKRGDGVQPLPLEDAQAALAPAADLIAVDQALRKLAAVDARKARIVELRVFMGLTVEEVANVLGVSPETVKRDWRLSKAWLATELGAT